MAPRQAEHLLVAKKKVNVNSRDSDLMKCGEILVDVHEKKWRLGKSIGVGAFGDVYLVSDEIGKPVPSDSKFVVKMEPHTSGPLFVEMNFYLRVAKEYSIDEWKREKRMKHLGLPHIFSFGSHHYRGTRMRFIVMPRYSDSIHKIFIKHNKFHVKTAMTIAKYTLDVLEYIHHHGYIHADIKSLNIVLGVRSDQAPLYLLDYGLAAKFLLKNGSHKDNIPDGRIADAGTLEFSSRDAHLGVITRRSDMESLGYNLVTWLGGKLPWIDDLYDSDLVLKYKEIAMSDVDSFLSTSFSKKIPASLLEYFRYVSNLEFDSKPDYAYCKQIFSCAIKEAGFADDGKVTFDSHLKLKKKPTKRKVNCENIVSIKKRLITTKKENKIKNDDDRRILRNQETRNFRNFDWAMVLARNPEKINFKKKVKSVNTSVVSKTFKVSLTPAMKKVIENRKKRSAEVPSKRKRSDSVTTSGNGLTPAMEEVIANRKKKAFDLRISRRVTRSQKKISK